MTAVISPVAFDINGKHVLLSSATTFKLHFGDRITPVSQPAASFYLGEHIQAFGKLDAKSHALSADRVIIISADPADPATISARGIVDATLPARLPDTIVRAAGYKVLISPKASIAYLSPISSATAIHTNLWIAFQGKQQPDGTILANKVVWAENTLSKRDKKLSEKTEYDPGTIEPESRQSVLSKSFLGIDPKKIPPYEDHNMQARITGIGAKLIPQYQRALPADNPTKINFRFQLVDQGSWHQPLTLGSGIILVPFQLVSRMQNDSQLAALLADSIAMAIEKQSVDTQMSLTPLIETAGLGVAGALFAPVAVGTLAVQAAGIPGAVSGAKLLKQQDEERLRVSLFMMHDAGYDVDEAPHAWWLPNSKKKDLSRIALPHRAAYLYQILGTTWHTPQPD